MSVIHRHHCKALIAPEERYLFRDTPAGNEAPPELWGILGSRLFTHISLRKAELISLLPSISHSFTESGFPLIRSEFR